MVVQNFRGQTRSITREMAVHRQPKKSNHRGIFFDKIYRSLPGEAVDIDFFVFSAAPRHKHGREQLETKILFTSLYGTFRSPEPRNQEQLVFHVLTSAPQKAKEPWGQGSLAFSFCLFVLLYCYPDKRAFAYSLLTSKNLTKKYYNK